MRERIFFTSVMNVNLNAFFSFRLSTEGFREALNSIMLAFLAKKLLRA